MIRDNPFCCCYPALHIPTHHIQYCLHLFLFGNPASLLFLGYRLFYIYLQSVRHFPLLLLLTHNFSTLFSLNSYKAADETRAFPIFFLVHTVFSLFYQDLFLHSGLLRVPLFPRVNAALAANPLIDKPDCSFICVAAAPHNSGFCLSCSFGNPVAAAPPFFRHRT